MPCPCHPVYFSDYHWWFWALCFIGVFVFTDTLMVLAGHGDGISPLLWVLKRIKKLANKAQADKNNPGPSN